MHRKGFDQLQKDSNESPLDPLCVRDHLENWSRIIPWYFCRLGNFNGQHIGAAIAERVEDTKVIKMEILRVCVAMRLNPLGREGQLLSLNERPQPVPEIPILTAPLVLMNPRTQISESE